MGDRRLIGPYRLERLLGSGGSGEVYAAVHERIGQRVAVKVLAGDAAGDPRARARFLDEARTLSRLDHPGIVRILGCDVLDDGSVWVAMEQVSGESLRARLQREPMLAPAEALAIAAQIAAAMSAVHARGVVHRDLKPENVMLAGGRDPQVKILDFGIAKSPPAERGLSADTRVETGEAALLGSIDYMAPEQIRDAAAAGPAADVYALGVILYEMLAGERPFDAKDAIDVATMHLRDAPPPLVAGVSEATEALALAMLDKDPARRPSMEAVRAALVRPEETIAPRPRPRAAFPAVARWGVVVTAMSVAAGALYEMRRGDGGLDALLAVIDRDVDEDDWSLAEKPDTLPERRRKLEEYARQLSGLPEKDESRVVERRIRVAHRRGDNALRWGTLHEAEGFFEEARALIGEGWPELRALNASKRGKVALAQGNKAAARARFAEALAGFGELVRASPGKADYRQMLAISEEEEADVLTEEGDLRGALARLESAARRLEGSADAYDAVQYAEAEVLLAEGARRAGELERAGAASARALRTIEPFLLQSPTNAVRRFVHARAELVRPGGDRATAIGRLRALADEDLTNKPYALVLGAALAGARPDECRVLLRRFLRHDPDDVRFRRIDCDSPRDERRPSDHGGLSRPQTETRTMNFQTQFRQFHTKIHLSYADSADLRAKRDRILGDLRARLDRPFDWFNQGSYQMGTGVRPLDGDYDLDAGIVFKVAPGDFPPNTVKEWVFKAAAGITQNVLWRDPCVTVQYVQGGKPLYHVDLAVFAVDGRGRRYLSRGKQHASREVQQWQLDDREGFQQKFAAKYANPEDAFQLRRVVSYLKRWRQENVPKEHWGALTGHVLTVAAYQWFDVRKSGAGEYNDLGALQELVNRMIQGFKPVGGAERLVVRFPCDPMDDVASRMSADQMKQFKLRLENLRDQLAAGARGDWTQLRKAFGADFPGV